MKPATFLFEGEELTVAQIRQRVPVLPDVTIRKHLHDGRRTRQAMLTYDEAAARRRNGRAGRFAAEAQGLVTSHSGRGTARAAASGFVPKPRTQSEIR